MTDLSSNDKNKNRRKFQKELKTGKVEKTFQVVTEEEVSANKADKKTPPDITLRDLENKTRRKKRREQDNGASRQEQIKITKHAEAQEDYKEKKPQTSAVSKKDKKKKSDKSKDTNVTDIRAARQKEKNKKRIKNIIILVIIAAFAAGVYLLRDIWVPKLEGILDYPHDTIVNDGKKKKGNFPISFEESSVSGITHLDNYLVSLDKNHLVIYNENGEETNSYNHNYADPELKTAVKRMLLFDNGGSSFKVVNRKNELYEKSIDGRIVLADIADNSNVAIVTEGDKYASVLTVYDSNGSEIYTWSSTTRILSVSFAKGGDGCYVTSFSSKGGSIRSVVRYFKFNSTEEVMKSEPLDILALEVMENDNGDFWVVGDTAFCKLDGSGNLILSYEYSSSLVDYDLSAECAALAFNGIQRKSTDIVMFNSDSDSKTSDNQIYTDDGCPKRMYIENGKIILLKENNIEAYDFSGNLLATADVSTEYVDFTFFNENVYFLGYREINKIAFST